MKWKYSFIHICMISLICLLVCQMPLQATTIDIPPTASKAIVFLLDASNSMNSNDRERLAKDSNNQKSSKL